jgi:hypothetical protein
MKSNVKKTLLIATVLFSMIGISVKAQKYGSQPAEKFGRTLNVGVGLVPYRNTAVVMPGAVLNFEIDIARNITLAPFIGIYTRSNNYYWGDKNYAYKKYNYREIAVPTGIKVVYYFDELLRANSKWDFYAGASLGFVFHSTIWDANYYGDKNAVSNISALYAAPHIGARCHLNQKVGIYLDLSTALSTFGFSFKL